MKALGLVWRDKRLSRALQLRIFEACVVSKLLYGLGTAWPHDTLVERLEACYVRSLRKVMGIMATYGSIKADQKPIPNAEVLRRAGLPPSYAGFASSNFRTLGTCSGAAQAIP
eukprot:7208983-Alexandrium_andersonii.AAC.1